MPIVQITPLKVLDPVTERELFESSEPDHLWDGSGFLIAMTFVGILFLLAFVGVKLLPNFI